MKKNKNERTKDHPFHSDYSVLKEAFDLLKRKNERDRFVLLGNCTNDPANFEILNFKYNRIEETEKNILKIYEEHLIRKNKKVK